MLRKNQAGGAVKFLFLALLLLFSGREGIAASLIRDSEIEEYLETLAEPVFKEARVTPKVYVILDPTPNAFATEGQRIFVHSGLIFLVERPDQLLGVLAHETGHIAGGHLVRLAYQINQAQVTAMISAVLGGIAAAFSGKPEALIAGVAGGQMSALGNLMRYQQSEEQAADQMAVSYLAKTGVSPSGLLDVMMFFEQQERFYPQSSFSYLRTHPLSTDRKSFLARMVQEQNKRTTRQLDLAQFKRIQIKLYAFTETPQKTLSKFPDSDYAKSIAFYKSGQMTESIRLLSKIVSESPDDPFLNELLAQFYFESGDAEKSFPYYAKAMQIRPLDFLIAYGAVQTAVETDNRAYHKQAESFIPALVKEPSPGVYKLYARLYEKLGKKAHMAYGMAEYSAYAGNFDQADSWIRKAKSEKDGSHALTLQILDFESSLPAMRKSKKNNR